VARAGLPVLARLVVAGLPTAGVPAISLAATSLPTLYLATACPITVRLAAVRRIVPGRLATSTARLLAPLVVVARGHRLVPGLVGAGLIARARLEFLVVPFVLTAALRRAGRAGIGPLFAHRA
jgi:hypothetical protein